MHDATHKGQLSVATDVAPKFMVAKRSLPETDTFQVYFQYGMTVAGPWAKLGLNHTEYLAGFVPQNILDQCPVQQLLGYCLDSVNK
jgi:hypothetical protein